MGVLERFSLRGRVALVTGGAGPQFGSSLSEGLAEADATACDQPGAIGPPRRERGGHFSERLGRQRRTIEAEVTTNSTHDSDG